MTVCHVDKIDRNTLAQTLCIATLACKWKEKVGRRVELRKTSEWTVGEAVDS